MQASHNGLWINGLSIVDGGGQRVQHLIRRNLPPGQILPLHDLLASKPDIKQLILDVTCLPLQRKSTGIELLVMR
jgi:hypothetical protein